MMGTLSLLVFIDEQYVSSCNLKINKVKKMYKVTQTKKSCCENDKHTRIFLCLNSTSIQKLNFMNALMGFLSTIKIT